MTTKENIVDKLKKLAAGATIMTGLAMGTGCGGSQQIHKVPTEDVVDDNDEDKPIESNDSGDIIENNDKDEQPINNNDSDDVIENNDKDEQPINNNDSDDVIENNDSDNNEPTENDDSDNTPGYYYVTNNFTPEDMVATKEEINNSPDEVNKKLQSKHSTTWNECPTHDWQSNEEYDEAGNLYVVDKCKITMDNKLRWLENVVPTWFSNAYSYTMTSPTTYRIVYMQVDYANKGSPSNVKIRQPFVIYDIDLTSANCLGQTAQATEDTSVITATPMSGAMKGCYLDDTGDITKPIQTKNVKQTRDSSAQDIALCATMPNHQYDEETNTCYTTVEEFGWVENIPHTLLNKKGFSWKTNGYRVNRIERHLDTNTFYMDIQMKNMNIHVELPNAKSCMLQCQGQEGCTVHIEPSPDASKGCFVNGEESAQNLNNQKHNLKHKLAPRFIKPVPTVAKQHYAKNITTNRQKWLARNIRNFGHNGR